MRTSVFSAAALVAAVSIGCSGQSPLSPDAGLGGSTDAAASRDTTTVHRFSDGTAIAGASSTLVRNANGVTANLKTSELAAGSAVTLWFVVFNNPGACATNPCGPADFGTAAVMPLVTHAAGHVIGGNGEGNFSGSLREGAMVANLLGGMGALTDAEGAEVHIVVRTHGDKTPGNVPTQIHTYEGTCAVAVCNDIQFSIHLP